MLTVKFDFLTLDETFNDLFATTGAYTFAATGFGVPPFISFAGAGSVNLLNSTVVGNLNYRFDLYPNFWIEPTVGVQYTNSSYGSGAAQLGLADGNLVRVQGGARFGTSTLLGNGVLMTTILTGLAYNDVVVQGGFFPVGFQANNLLVQADQGFMRGQGILALNFDFGNGMELVRARRCLRGSAPVRRWRQGRHTLPVVRGNSPGASCLTSPGLCPHCAAFARNGGWHSGDCGPRTRDPALAGAPPLLAARAPGYSRQVKTAIASTTNRARCASPEAVTHQAGIAPVPANTS